MYPLNLYSLTRAVILAATVTGSSRAMLPSDYYPAAPIAPTLADTVASWNPFTGLVRLFDSFSVTLTDPRNPGLPDRRNIIGSDFVCTTPCCQVARDESPQPLSCDEPGLTGYRIGAQELYYFDTPYGGGLQFLKERIAQAFPNQIFTIYKDGVFKEFKPYQCDETLAVALQSATYESKHNRLLVYFEPNGLNINDGHILFHQSTHGIYICLYLDGRFGHAKLVIRTPEDDDRPVYDDDNESDSDQARLFPNEVVLSLRSAERCLKEILTVSWITTDDDSVADRLCLAILVRLALSSRRGFTIDPLDIARGINDIARKEERRREDEEEADKKGIRRLRRSPKNFAQSPERLVEIHASQSLDSSPPSPDSASFKL